MGHLVLQHLDQARFANAGFAAEQHHLPEAVFSLRPALRSSPFLLPAHQRRQALRRGRVQATAGRGL